MLLQSQSLSIQSIDNKLGKVVVTSQIAADKAQLGGVEALPRVHCQLARVRFNLGVPGGAMEAARSRIRSGSHMGPHRAMLEDLCGHFGEVQRHAARLSGGAQLQQRVARWTAAKSQSVETWPATVEEFISELAKWEHFDGGTDESDRLKHSVEK